MKHLLLLAFVFIATTSFAKFETVIGNGNLKKETRNISGFDALSSAGMWNVEIKYGTSNTLEVEADENLLPYVVTEVKDNKLQIKAKNFVNIRTKNKINVYVSMTKLTDLSLSGSGNVNGAGAFSNDSKTTFHVSGSGNVNMEFGRIKEIETSVSGSGNVILKAKDNGIDNVDIKVSGSGNVDCSEVACNDASVKISGSGNAKVYANKSIQAKVAGSGNVYYKGDAKNVSVSSTHKNSVVRM